MDLGVPDANQKRFSDLGILFFSLLWEGLGLSFLMEEGVRKAGKRVRKTLRDSH